MHRRNIRLRIEYLCSKSLEGKEPLLYEKKRKNKEALEVGKPIPTELRNEEAALRKEIDLEDEHTADVILMHEHRGVPDGIIISHLPFGPTAYFGLLNVIGERTINILKHLSPVPKPDTKHVIAFANQSDHISFRGYSLVENAGSMVANVGCNRRVKPGATLVEPYL
ncbi:hypothetical protein HAX54_009494 [Datura stramonium]|uniref:Brix domain-containing protein n=1 Tax=Datura stramonium TaxID=4076 RepID=A0ABS8TFP7_DATST|nr:hypothetical protein [Datura stramonium]